LQTEFKGQWPAYGLEVFGDLNFSKVQLINPIQLAFVCCIDVYLHCLRLKIKGDVLALNGSPFQSYGASLAIWDHTVLRATQHR